MEQQHDAVNQNKYEGKHKMNTEIFCVRKIGINKYFNAVFNFTGTLQECEVFARRKNFGGGVEILNNNEGDTK